MTCTQLRRVIYGGNFPSLVLEQLDRTERETKHVEENIRLSQWLYRGINSFTGAMWNLVAPVPHKESQADNKKESKTVPSINKENQTEACKELSEIESTVKELMKISETINQELSKQDELLERIDTSVDKSKSVMHRFNSIQ